MNDTVVAVLTPPGRGALATLGLFGPAAWDLVRGLFSTHSGRPLPERPAPGTWWLGQAGADLADQAILSLLRTDPVPLAELHVHGGREVSRYLLELLVTRGARNVSWEEFHHHTVGHTLRAEAAIALTRATTVRTAAILLDQYHGALERELSRVDAARRQGAADEARAILAGLLRWVDLGRHLTVPYRVVVAGAPNVGKSSLVNALAGYQRSIVSPQPGTTRDVVTTTLALDGWPVELADTAGLRVGGESLEAAGIEQARLAMAAADCVLWVVDAADEPVWPGIESPRLHVVVNKIDRPSAWDLAVVGAAPRVSATSGAGIAELVALLAGWLVPEVPPPGTAVPFTARQIEEITERASRLAGGPAAS